MATPKFNLTPREGATFRKRLRWLDAKRKAINLTGCVVTIEFRPKADDPTVLLALNVGNGRLTITPLTGTIDIYLSAADTAVLTFAKCAWDCKVVLSNGDVRYILEGQVLVTRSVTV